MIFETRYIAGKSLSTFIKNKVEDLSNTIVLGILTGGAQITEAIAEELNIPASFVAVKKIKYKNYDLGIVIQDGTNIYNKKLIEKIGLSKETVSDHRQESYLKVIDEKERFELHLNNNLAGKNIIVVDDGVISGLTAVGIAKFCKSLGINNIILATPIANSNTIKILQNYYNQVITIETTEDRNFALSKYYMSYYKLGHDDITEIIQKLKAKGLLYS